MPFDSHFAVELPVVYFTMLSWDVLIHCNRFTYKAVFMLLFFCIFTGFMKLGITIALINVSQRSKTLLHSLMISRAKFIIVGEGNLFSCTPDLGVINFIEAQHN